MTSLFLGNLAKIRALSRRAYSLLCLSEKWEWQRKYYSWQKKKMSEGVRFC